MKDIYLFEIPIYRCSFEKYRDEVGLIKERALAVNKHMGLPEATFVYPSWRFNEIIGWVQVTMFNGGIRSEAWLVRQRVVKGLRKKEFTTWGKLFKYRNMSFSEMSNKNICKEFRTKLLEVFAEAFPKYSLDLWSFNTVAENLDWKALIKQSIDG